MTLNLRVKSFPSSVHRWWRTRLTAVELNLQPSLCRSSLKANHCSSVTGNWLLINCTLVYLLCCCYRLVNTILQEELKTIHAFSQKTLTPEQWRQQQAQAGRLVTHHHKQNLKNNDFIKEFHASTLTILTFFK
jgi:hypothetical protein